MKKHVLQVGSETFDSPAIRTSPFVVRGGRQKLLASVTLENKKENAYNTSLNLSFSRNLHLASLTPQVSSEEEREVKEDRKRKPPRLV